MATERVAYWSLYRRSAGDSLVLASRSWLALTLITGGSPSLPPGLPAAYYQGFHGCVRSAVADRATLDLSSASRPHRRQHHPHHTAPPAAPPGLDFCHHTAELP